MGKEDRPSSLSSLTQRIQTGYGKVYVTIGFNEDDEPFEVFINTGNSGGFTNSWCEALGKTLSNALRSGADAGELADDLLGIQTHRVQDDNGDTVYSIPDGVGIALKRAVKDKLGEPVRIEEESEL